MIHPASRLHARGLILTFLGVLNFLHVFGRFFFEILQATFAAEFDFLSFMREHVRFPVFPEFFIGDDAFIERIRFCLFIGCVLRGFRIVVVSFIRAHQRWSSDQQDG